MDRARMLLVLASKDSDTDNQTLETLFALINIALNEST